MTPPPFDPYTCPPAQLYGLIAELHRGEARGIKHTPIVEVIDVEPGWRDVVVGCGNLRSLDDVVSLSTPGRDGREVWRRA